MNVQRFELPLMRPYRASRAEAVGLLLATAIGGLALAFLPVGGGAWVGALLGAVLFGLLLFLALYSRRPQPFFAFVDVGVDGVLVGPSFVAYDDIRRVGLFQEEHSTDGNDMGGGATWYEWKVVIEAKGGHQEFLGLQTIELLTKSCSDKRETDPYGAEVLQAIKAAWAARKASKQRSDGLAVEVALARGERTGAEWLEALRAFGSGDGGSYRQNAASAPALMRVLDDPQGKPSSLAAAAIALGASGDGGAAAKLRVAAEAIADPRVRVALQNVADETGVAEALETLEEIEPGQNGITSGRA